MVKLILGFLILLIVGCSNLKLNYNKIGFQKERGTSVGYVKEKNTETENLDRVTISLTSDFENSSVKVDSSAVTNHIESQQMDLTSSFETIPKIKSQQISENKTLNSESNLFKTKVEQTKDNSYLKLRKTARIFFTLGTLMLFLGGLSVITFFLGFEVFAGIAYYCLVFGVGFNVAAFFLYRALKKKLHLEGKNLTSSEKVMKGISFCIIILPVLGILSILIYFLSGSYSFI